MSTRIDVHELPGRFREAVDIVAAGGEVVLTDGSALRAKLVSAPPEAAAPPRPPRVLGLHAGMIEMADDFDAPLPEEFWTGG